jgi:hypothetical protein
MKFPSLEVALGTVMLRVMSEGLSTSTSDDQMQKLDAVRDALRALWPDELATATKRTRFVPHDGGGVVAMYDDSE